MPSERLNALFLDSIPLFDIRLYSAHWFAHGTMALIAYLECA